MSNANGDNAIDGMDLGIWKGHYGPASVAAANAAPDTVAIVLAANPPPLRVQALQ